MAQPDPRDVARLLWLANLIDEEGDPVWLCVCRRASIWTSSQWAHSVGVWKSEASAPGGVGVERLYRWLKEQQIELTGEFLHELELACCTWEEQCPTVSQ